MASHPSNQASPNPKGELEFKRKHLPLNPGCYLFRNKQGAVLYVGKAKSLRKRVNSYFKDFTKSKGLDLYSREKLRQLQKITADVDVFVVENEMEALLLENELIKQHQPRFNVLLRDSKSYPWVQITKEEFPRIKVVRSPERYGLHHTYIGPFVDSGHLKQMLKYLRKIFPYCTCKKSIERTKRKRPCTYYQINLCPAPCAGKITPEAYQENIQSVIRLLQGDTDSVAKDMTHKMDIASEELQFEEAALWRDRLEALNIFTVDQSILSYSLGHEEPSSSLSRGIKQQETRTGVTPPPKSTWKDLDVAAQHFSATRAGVLLLHVRRGRLISKTPYIVDLKEKITTEGDFFASILRQHYLRANILLPEEIILDKSLDPDFVLSLQNHFSDQGHSTIFRLPSEEDKTAGLLRIAQKNIDLLIQQKEEYEQYLQNQDISAKDDNPRSRGLRILQELLHLEDPPLIIEAFDMSHLQGTDYVGSKVCLVEGRPSKRDYRRYKIKDPTITASDDIAAMKEVMTRRYTRASRENETYPDLILVDGGKGQLNMAHNLLTKLGIGEIPIIGLSKPPGRSEIYSPPNIILPKQKTPIILPKDSPALHLLQLIRDESHRFAIKYHRTLRKKRQTHSELDDIPGVGPARKKKLLQFFGSVDEIKSTPGERLGEVVGTKLGQEIYNYFKTKAKATESKPKTKTTKKKKIVLRRKPS